MHAIDYAPQHDTWPAMLARLQRLRYRAAVVGPHGSGKTTLLRSLAPRLEVLGFRPRPLFRNADRGSGGGWPASWHETLAGVESRDVLLVDGYDHLAAIPRIRLRLMARRAAGIVVTAHARCGLPTLVRTAPSPALLQWIVSRLTPDTLDDAAAAALLARHRGNMREALRELYDRAASGGESSGSLIAR